MRFYDALQLDPAGLKKMIRASEHPGEKRKLGTAMAVRSVLLVLFSTLMISPATAVFGAENSAMAVSLLCILLGIRFVDFGYCIRDSLINLALVFGLLWLAPCAAAQVSPLWAAVIHVTAFFLILFMTSDRPEMGNAGLYTFAYIFLSGNPVSGELFWLRGGLTAVGFVLCGSILFAKHRTKNRGVSFADLLRNFSLRSHKTMWQLQLALGVGILLGIGSMFNLERVMWAAFACGSILGCYSATADGVRERFSQRMVGTLLGTVIFFAAYQIIPSELHMLLGLLGGVCLGFCADYRSKTACNCLGALFVASGLFGLHETLMLRVLQNLAGLVFGWIFWHICQAVCKNSAASCRADAAEEA